MNRMMIAKGILISALCGMFAQNVRGQGVVTFNNGVLPDVQRRTVRTIDGFLLVGTQWAAQLYYGTSATSLAAHTAAPQRFRATTTTSPGTWSATGASRTLVGGGVGVPVFMQARVWNLDLFATYEAALAGGGFYGSTAIFQYTQRASVPPATDDTYMLNFDGLLIPEPSAVLLAIPAMAFLMFLRRGASSRN